MEAVEKKPCKEETVDEVKADATEKEKENEKENEKEVVVSKKKTPIPKVEEGKVHVEKLSWHVLFMF